MTCLSDPGWDAVFAGPMAWPANARLLRQGVVPPTIYVLDEGTIKMVYVTAEGHEQVIDIRRAPVLLGAPFVITGRPCSVDAITLTPCSVRWCSAEAFVSVSANDAARVGDMLRWQCAETVDLCERAVVMSLKRSGQRLRHFMAHHGVVSGDGRARPALPFKQSLVASFINVTPEHLSRLMKKMAGPGPGESRSRSPNKSSR